jgi:uncharacterized surface protein with fasciclin (FAS1) repeats
MARYSLPGHSEEIVKSKSKENSDMARTMFPLALAIAFMAVAGCTSQDQASTAENATATKGAEAVKEAGDKTIASGLDQNSRFVQAAKAAGIDATLAGPGPYTVFVADDAAFNKLPQGEFENWMKPESRTELTRVLTYQILPGTVLADDIGKAVDNGKGKAQLATMGGGTLTATKEDGKIVLTDAAGHKATITKADETLANGVVHQVDTVLMPS